MNYLMKLLSSPSVNCRLSIIVRSTDEHRVSLLCDIRMLSCTTFTDSIHNHSKLFLVSEAHFPSSVRFPDLRHGDSLVA